MTEKEVFKLYIASSIHSREGYLIANKYYHEDADETEKKQYERFMERIMRSLEVSYQKSEHHFRLTAKRYGLDESEAFALIESKKENDPISYLRILEDNGQNPTQYLQTLYQKCEKARWNKIKLEEIAKESEISYHLLIGLIELYLREYLKESANKINTLKRRIEESFYYNEFITAKRITNYYELNRYLRAYASVLEKENYNKTVEEILSVFDSSELSIHEKAQQIALAYPIEVEDARNLILSHERTETEKKDNQNEQEKKEKAVLKKMQEDLIKERNARRRLKDKLKKESVTEQEILIAKRTITDLIYKDIGVKSLISTIGSTNFYRMITIVELNDVPLYELYYAKTNRGAFVINEGVLSDLIDWIINGVEGNGVKRPFTLLDYFLNIRIPLNSLPNLLTNLSEREKAYILRFVSRSKQELKPLTNENEKELGVTKEEEKSIKIFLIENDIPFYYETYKEALTRFRSGILNFESNSRK